MTNIKSNKFHSTKHISFACIILFFLSGYVLSQPKEFDLNNLEQEEWEILRDYFAVEAIKLLAKLDSLNSEIDSLRKLNYNIDNLDCSSELYKLVGGFSNSELEDYRNKFNFTEERILSRTGLPKDARENHYNEISSSKLKCLPEFSERFNNMSFQLNQWESSVDLISGKRYMVESGDNLRKIAQKFLGDHNLWNLLWQANKEIIKNPNLIFPGQVLIIPPMQK